MRRLPCCMNFLKKYFYFGIFLIPLIFNPWAGNEVYETAKVSWFLFFVAFGLLAGVFSLWRSEKIILPPRPIVLAACVLFLSFFVSTIFSTAPIESFWGSYDRQQGLLIQIPYIVHFFICLYFFRDSKTQSVFFQIILWTGVLIAAYSLAQKFGFDPVFRGPKGIFTGRATGTLGSPPSLGQFLVFPWWVAFGEMLKKIRDKKWLGAFCFLAGLLLISGGLWASLNRASLLGIGIAVGIFAFFHIRTWQKRIGVAAGAMLLTLFVLATFASHPGLENSKFLSLRSLGSRAVLWRSAVSAIPHSLWTGSGPETTYQSIQTTLSPELYRYERLLDTPDRVHNIFLEILLTRGVLGIIVLLIIIGTSLARAWKTKPKNASAKTSFFALLSYGIALQFGFSVVTHIVVLLGFAAVFFASRRQEKPNMLKFGLVKKIILTGAALFFTAIFLMHGYKITKTEFLVSKGLTAFFQGKTDAASQFENAWRSLPHYREIPYMAFSLFLEESRREPRARQYVQAAQQEIARITNNSFYAYLTAGQLAASEHRTTSAWADFSSAAFLAPNWPGVWYKWGMAALQAGDRVQAKEKLQKFLDFAPTFGPNEKEARRIFEISNPTYFEVKNLVKTL